MNAGTILSILRLADFTPGVHEEAQRSTQWPHLAIIPHVLPCGSANLKWAQAKYGVAMAGREAVPVKLGL